MKIPKKWIILYSLLIGLCVFLRQKAFFLILCAGAGYYLYFFNSLKRQVRSLRVRRRAPKQGQEKDSIVVTYEISNFSPFVIFDLVLKDSFSGSEKFQIEREIKIKAHQRIKVNEEFVLNAGMGEKFFSGLSVKLSDPLGFLSEEKVFDHDQLFEVYPLIEGPSRINATTNSYSYHFGEIDISKKGESTNFMGVREYRPGDAIKKMNWRQTFKHQRAIVNVYEKNVNKTFTLLFNCDARLHSGEGAQSTFEYLKDELLSLACDHINNGNQIKIVTNTKKTPLGSGAGFIKELEKFVYSLDLIKEESPQHLVRRQATSLETLSEKEDSFVYFTPILPGPLYTTNMEDLVGLRKQGREVHVVWVNAFPFLNQAFPFGGQFSVSVQLEHTQKLEEEWRRICFINQIEHLSYQLGEKSD